MNASDNRPVHQLVKAVLGEPSVRQNSSLDEHIVQNPSVFDLIKLGVAGLRKLGLSSEQSRALLSRGNALALHMARVYREQSLRAEPPDEDSALVPLPTYKEQFNPDIDGAAPPGSPEHAASTTAYMVSLREWVRDHIVPQGDPATAITLDERRPDVDALLVDEMAINRVQSRLEIANRVLEAMIDAKPSTSKSSVKAYLRTIRFHNSLPYDHDWQGISHVVGQVIKDGALGDIIRRVDLDYPYFKNSGGLGRRADAAFQLSCAIGPLHLSLLLEDPYFPLEGTSAQTALRRVDPITRRVDPDPQASADSFYPDNFGSLANFMQSLRRLWIFKSATRLDQRGVDCLLGRGTFTPTLSANAPALGNPDIPVTGVTAGARFVHGGETPAIGLAPDGGDLFLLTHVGEQGFEKLEHRMDRINRKCRLDRMLQLSSHEVDQLLVAAMQAEFRRTAAPSLWIRPNTLRCLGLFKELNSQYGCKAEEFAALIDVLSVYGQDGQLSHFDRVYNGQALYENPLLIDDIEFAIVPRTEDEEHTVHQICTALDINFETYRYLATVIAEAYGLSTHLKRSLEIYSSFWRLVWLGRMVDLTPIESTALLQTLSAGEGLAAQLAGAPAVSVYGTGDGADALSAIRGLVTCANWLREYDLSAMWLVQNVNPVYVPTVWSPAQEQFLHQLRMHVQSVLVQEATLLEEGAPLHDGQQKLIQWRVELEPLVDVDGVVKGSAEETEARYLERIAAFIKDLVMTLFPIAPSEGDNEYAARIEPLTTLLRTVVLRSRDEQRVVVHEGLSVYLKLDSLLVPQALAWAQGHPYEFLKAALSIQPTDTPRVQQTIEKPDSFLEMFAELERRARVIKTLELSAPMLSTLLIDEQYQWFSLENPYDISVRTVYFLAFFRRMIVRARQPEAKILDYLHQVNQLPDDLSEDALRLMRDAAADRLATYFGCGIRHVLECAAHICGQTEDGDDPVRPILANLAHLDLLERTLELARHGLDATSAFELGALYPLDPEPVYASAAQSAFESMARFSAQTTRQDTAEVGQSFTTRCVVDNARLIANLPQEVAEFEITLLDFYGEPLKGVDIHWSTDLGAILTPVTRTDQRGRALALLQAGARMGTAHVSFNLPLYDPVYAPSVVIDCDEPSLHFSSEMSGVPPRDPVLAGRLWEQEMYAVMIDGYLNRGAHRPVAWSTTLGDIRPSETFTDKDGKTRVWISSQSPGEAYITVSYVEGNHSMTFTDPIVFADKPRIRSAPFLTSVALLGCELTARCQVVSLDDAPLAGADVEWWTSAEPAKITLSSDEDGFCDFSLADPPSGELTLYVQRLTTPAGTDPELALTVWVSSTAVIAGFPATVEFPVAGSARPTLLWVDVRELSDSNARPVENYPVVWTGGPAPNEEVTIVTDAQGRSVYPFKSATVGNFTVVAGLQHHPDQTRPFALTVIKDMQWTVTLIEFLSDGTELTQPIEPGWDELVLYRNSRYKLKILPDGATQLTGSQAALGWSSDYTAQALGMVLEPPLGTRFTWSDSSFDVDITTANIRNGRFQLNLFCDRLSEALVIEGSLSKRPATRRSPAQSANGRPDL